MTSTSKPKYDLKTLRAGDTALVRLPICRVSDNRVLLDVSLEGWVSHDKVVEILERKQTPKERIAELEAENAELRKELKKAEHAVDRFFIKPKNKDGRLFVAGLPIKERGDD